MSLSPKDWSVVVAGSWNRAILTPAGIRKRLFRLDDGTPIEVQLPIDQLKPPQVKHDGIYVIADSNNLILRPHQCSFDELDRARLFAINALESLPETPITAIGINMRYTSAIAIPEFFDALDSSWDTSLSETGYTINESDIKRSLSWNNGFINLFLSYDKSNHHSILFNFEIRSNNHEDLKNWLSAPIDILKSQITKIFSDTLHIKNKDITYEQE